MLGFLRHGPVVVLLLVNALLFAMGDTEDGILTDHLLVQLREGSYDEAPQVAMEHGFESVRKVRCEVSKNKTGYCLPCPFLSASNATALINIVLRKAISGDMRVRLPFKLCCEEFSVSERFGFNVECRLLFCPLKRQYSCYCCCERHGLFGL